jgi:hypothetical protein
MAFSESGYTKVRRAKEGSGELPRRKQLSMVSLARLRPINAVVWSLLRGVNRRLIYSALGANHNCLNVLGQLDSRVCPRAGRPWKYFTSDQPGGKHADSVPSQTLQPYVLFCVPTPAVSPYGAYLSHIYRSGFSGHDFFTKSSTEFDRLRGSTRWSRFWARFRVIGCQEITYVSK